MYHATHETLSLIQNIMILSFGVTVIDSLSDFKGKKEVKIIMFYFI